MAFQLSGAEIRARWQYLVNLACNLFALAPLFARPPKFGRSDFYLFWVPDVGLAAPNAQRAVIQVHEILGVIKPHTPTCEVLAKPGQ